jgi:hypothetical protein
MRGSVVLAGAIIGMASLVGAPAHAGSAPDPYSGNIDTACSVTVPATVEAGKHTVIKVTVSANSPKTPKGHVDLTLSDAGGDAVWTKTVSYNGGTKTVVGPALPKADYVVKAKFRPSGNKFDPSRCSDAVDSIDDNPDEDGPGGLLPDTGGPALLWLVVGVTLVGGGAGAVAYSRRRSAPATA